ncbi:MAG: DNA primase [Christensenellales bacterium]
MAENFSAWLDDFKSRINIADVVGKYVTLTPKGGRLWACCPFHHEKTPSFCVSEERNSYHCFGCHVGGDAIAFVMEIEHTDFMGALRILADMYNVSIPVFERNGDNDGNVKRHKDRLYELMRLTAKYYHDNLMSQQGAAALSYWTSRGLSGSTVTAFGLGYSLGYNQLIAYLASKGFKQQEMIDAGVAEMKDGKCFDALAGRVIVPIVNNLKQVVAFGGRRIVDNDHQPKYKNTKETIIFNKSNELFGQNNVKKLQMKESVNTIIMVEGYMDVIALYQAGIHNAMASMGTALTEKQARLIKRYVDNVIICYDGDAAGQKATVRGLDILYKAGLNVKVMSLPEGLDPDEYIKKYGRESYMTLMMQALPLFEFRLRKLAEGFDLSTAEGKGKYAVEAMKILKELGNPAQIEAYIPIVVEYTSINRDVLYQQYAVTQDSATIKPKTIVRKKGNSFDEAVRFVLYALYGGVEGVECSEDLTQYLVDPNHVRLYDTIRAKGIGNVNLDDLSAQEENNPEVREILAAGSKVSDEVALAHFNGCLAKILKTTNQQKLKALSEMIDKEENEETRKLLIGQYIQLAKNK